MAGNVANAYYHSVNFCSSDSARKILVCEYHRKRNDQNQSAVPVQIIHLNILFGAKYSRMDQVKFLEDSL